MVYRLPDARVTLDLDGPQVEVQRLIAPGVWLLGMRDLEKVISAKGPDGQIAGLVPLYERLVAEAKPVWDIADHAGAVPVTASGMLRLPIELGLRIVTGWLETFGAEEPASAVDAIIEPGPHREALKKRLREKKQAA